MAAAVVTALAILAGCASSGTVVDPGADPAVQQVDLTKLPPLGLTPRWERSFAGSATVSVASDGSLTVAAADGVHFIDARGRDLWMGTATGPAAAVSGGLAVQGGTLSDSHDSTFWSDGTGDALRAVGSPDGSRVAALDDDAGQLTLLAGSGQTLGQVPVAAGAFAAFSDSGSLVVDDGTRVFLLNPDGSMASSFSTGADAPPRHLALSHRAQWLAVSTGGGDNTTYLFNLDGTPIWQRPAGTGGPADLVVAPDDRTVAIFRRGGAGIEGLSAASGQASWRLFLGGSVQGAAYLPDGRLMVNAGSAAGEGLLVLRPDGSPLAQQRLGGQRVYLAGAAGAAITLTQGDGTSVVRWYSLNGGA